MIGKSMKKAIIESINIIGHNHAASLEAYLEYAEEQSEKIDPSVWVDLFELTGQSLILERLDPLGNIRREVQAGKRPGFIQWWGLEAPQEPTELKSEQLGLFH